MQKKASGLSVGGMVVGIISLLFSFVPCIGMLGGVLAVVGLVLSIIGYRADKKSGGPTAMGIVGMVLSGIAIAVAFAWGALIAKAGNDMNEPFEVESCDEILVEMDKAVKQMNAIKAKSEDADMGDLSSVIKTTTRIAKIRSTANEMECNQDSTFKAKMDLLSREID